MKTRKPKAARTMCDNCPARNNRIRAYLVEGLRKDLCIECAKTAVRLKLSIENL